MNWFLVFFVSLCALPSLSLAYSPEGYPGNFWNSLGTDFGRFDGVVEQGNLRQGVRWFTLPADISVNTYIGYRWRIRTLNREFFDAHGPVASLEFQKSIFNFGVQYEWQTFPPRNESQQYPSVYVNAFDSVDLLRGSRSLFGIPVVAAPFSGWARVMHDFGNFEGLGTMGYLSQAVEWFTLPAEVVFRTQALYFWRFRTLNKEFFDVHGPALGVELARGSLNLGAMYGWDRFPSLGRSTENFRVYLNWFLQWDLKN